MHCRKAFAIFLTLFIFCFCPLDTIKAEDALTWHDCIREAKKNNPDLASAQESLRQKAIDKAITQSAILPDITTSVEREKSKSPTTKKKTTAYSYSITGKQLLFDGFKTVADIKSASSTITAQEYNYYVTSSDIRLNLRNAFITLLRAQQLISLTEEIAARRKQNLELVKLRYEAGREHKGAFLTAEADLAEAEYEVAQARRNILVAQRSLSKEMGCRDFAFIRAEGAFEVEETESQRPGFESMANNTPFLNELIAKKEAARFNLDSARADFFPQVYLNSSFGRTASSGWPPENEKWSAGVSVSFPIFEGGSRIAEVSKARSQLRQAQENERSGRDEVILTFETTWKSLQDAIETVAVKKKFLDAAGERAKIASAQYSTGLIGFDDWIIIENNLVDAKKAYLDAQASSMTAEASWVQAKGGVLEYVQE